MRTRPEIKAIGKERFLTRYWPCVGVVALIQLVIVVVMAVFSIPSYISAVMAMIEGEMTGATLATAGFQFIGYAALIVLIGPLTVGENYFFVMNALGRDSEATVLTPFRTAFTNFGRKLGGCLWMSLFVFLWSLLLWVPGIVKSFSYAQTTYILADCPNVKARDALTLSKRIMDGHKWELFVFELSFLGWMILSSFTGSILDIFYVGPYMQSSLAVYYLEVREEALRLGTITMGQLEGTEAV